MDRNEIYMFFMVCIFVGVYLIAVGYQHHIYLSAVTQLKEDLASNAVDFVKSTKKIFEDRPCVCPYHPPTVKDLIHAPNIVIGDSKPAEVEPDDSSCSRNSYTTFYGLLICKGEDCCKRCMEKLYSTTKSKQTSDPATKIFASYCLNVEAFDYLPEMVEFFKEERRCKEKRQEAFERQRDNFVRTLPVGGFKYAY